MDYFTKIIFFLISVCIITYIVMILCNWCYYNLAKIKFNKTNYLFTIGNKGTTYIMPDLDNVVILNNVGSIVSINNPSLTFLKTASGNILDVSFGNLGYLSSNYRHILCNNNNKLTQIHIGPSVKFLDCSKNPIKKLLLKHPLETLIVSSDIQNLEELIPLCKRIYLID